MRTLRLVVGVISITIGVEILPVLGTSHYLVRSHELTVELSSQGQIVGVLVGKEAIRWDIHGQTELAGCRVEGLVQTEKRRDGGVRFKKKSLCDANQTRREV
jgi:gamma-glutamylcysteine synthetase